MDTVFRVAVLYIVILLFLRLLGKREFSSLSPLELVCLLLIPEIVSESLTRQDPSLVNAIVGLSTLMSLVFLNSMATQLWPRVGKLVSGEPTVLVKDGRLFERPLNAERVSPDEVFAEMRKVGLTDLAQVRWGILETDGKISIVPVDPSSTADGPPEEDSAAVV